MNPPTSIKVGPFRFSVSLDGRRMSEVAVNRQRIGQTDLIHGTIHIEPDMPEQHQRETLLHEVIHAVHYVVNAPEKMTQEEAVSNTAPMLLDVLQSNPDLVAYLLLERSA